MVGRGRCVLCVTVLLSVLACGNDAPGSGQETARVEDGIWRTSIGDGPVTVIVLHGGPGVPHRYLRPEWDELVGDARLLFYDQRGCGQSERTDSVTWERLADDLDVLVGAAGDHGPVALAGSSWGSILAVLYAYRHPGRVSSLVLSGVPGGLEWQLPGSRSSGTEFPFAEGGDSVVEPRVAVVTAADVAVPEIPSVWDSAEVVADSSFVVPELAARMGMACPRVRFAVSRSVRETAPPLDSLRRVDLPVLVLRGTEPTVVGDGAATLACRLPGARVVSIDGAGHDPWFERPTAFFSSVRAFLRDPDRPVAGAETVGTCPEPANEPPAVAIVPPPVSSAAGDGPSYLPRDVEPRLRNGDRIGELLRLRYPVRLREAGIGGRVTLWLYVDDAGTVVDRRIQRSSGHEALDRVATELVDSMRFTPATNGGAPVPVWIAQAIDFVPRDGAEP
jgi:proline iminopeptidase